MELLCDFKTIDWQFMSDKELMNWYYLSMEMQDGRYYKACKKEMNRRNAEL